MGFIFLTRGLWALLALSAICIWSLSAQGETRICRTGSANRHVLAHSTRTGCVAGLEAVDDPGGLLQVLRGPHSAQRRDSAVMSSVGGLRVGKVQGCCRKSTGDGAQGMMLMSHGTRQLCVRWCCVWNECCLSQSPVTSHVLWRSEPVQAAPGKATEQWLISGGPWDKLTVSLCLSHPLKWLLHSGGSQWGIFYSHSIQVETYHLLRRKQKTCPTSSEQ